MNKKEELARSYALNMYQSDLGYDKTDIQDAFESGWNEALKNQFCKCVNNKPEKGKEPKDGENVILLCQIVGGSNDGFIFPKVNTYKNGDWESKMLMHYNVIAWMPIPSFDEILETNKDVLKRLKDK